jgi:hypothetical protein
VDDAKRVSVGERGGDLGRTLCGRGHFQGSGALEPVPQTARRHVGHGVEEAAGGGTGIEERKDVRVVQLCLGADLTLEPLDSQGGAKRRVQYLERDPPPVA